MNTQHSLIKIALMTAMASVFAVNSGCANMSGLLGKKKANDVIATAENSDAEYYRLAQDAINRSQNQEAITHLNNLRAFYPTGVYAQQALLDLIYVQYQAGNFEEVTNHTDEFIRLYPTSKYIDYALYVQGVTNMGGAPKASRIFNLDQSQRNTAYLRIAFFDFQTLINNFPNSAYASDAAQRMIAIYNDLAENELVAARWYVKRDAMVAAANRAKWVFQYYPQSTAVPEAIAILAYTNQQLGLSSTAEQYKNLLKINYPQYLNQDGSVRLNHLKKQSYTKKLLSTVSFGRFGQEKDSANYDVSKYDGETRIQMIHQANALTLPVKKDEMDEAMPAKTDGKNSRRPSLGLGLPEVESSAGHLNDIPK